VGVYVRVQRPAHRKQHRVINAAVWGSTHLASELFNLRTKPFLISGTLALEFVKLRGPGNESGDHEFAFVQQ
jgi:hypothetical protein